MNIDGRSYLLEGLVHLGPRVRENTGQVCWASLLGPRGAAYVLRCGYDLKGRAWSVLESMGGSGPWRTMAENPEALP